MKVAISVSPIPKFPAPTGAHELAWSYLLDAIFADAYHAGLSILQISLPSSLLKDEAHLRADLSHGADQSGGVGVALLGHERNLPRDPQRVYVLEFGKLAPRALRKENTFDWPGWKLEHQLHVYTWKARLLGIPIRLTGMMNRPDLHDRFMFAMRRVFVNGHPVPAYYHLNLWSRQ